MSQNYSNHAKFVPPFHFFVLPVLLVNVGISISRVIRVQTFDSIFAVLFALALLMGVLFGRIFALKVQDRIIHLEMILRMKQLLPADLQPRIDEFTLEQLIGLRFASDSELPELSRKVLQNNIAKRKPIKQMIQNWKADELRA
jgi:hypothetical protein